MLENRRWMKNGNRPFTEEHMSLLNRKILTLLIIKEKQLRHYYLPGSWQRSQNLIMLVGWNVRM